MAMGDYRYINFKDEYDITELMLYAYPKMITAIAEKEKLLEKLAMIKDSSASAGSFGGGFSSGNKQIESYVDNVRYDKELLILNNIVNTIDNAIIKLHRQQRFFVEDYYWGDDIISLAEYAERHCVNRQSGSALRKRVVNSIKQACINVYPLFCRWRRMDETELKDIKEKETKHIVERLDKKKWGDN